MGPVMSRVYAVKAVYAMRKCSTAAWTEAGSSCRVAIKGRSCIWPEPIMKVNIFSPIENQSCSHFSFMYYGRRYDFVLVFFRLTWPFAFTS